MADAGSRSGHLAMLAFSALVAGSFSLGARVAGLIDPAALTLPRFALAAAATALLACAAGHSWRPWRAGAWRWLIPGAIYAFYFVLMFEGLKTADPVSAAAVFTLSPALSAGFGWLILRQVTTARMALAITIGALGALWVIFRADLSALLALQPGRGEVVYFIGCIAHAALPVMMRKLSRGEPPLVTSTLMLAGGFVTLLPWALPRVLQTDWSALPGIVWITLIYVALFASAATAVLMQHASQRLPGAKVMAYTYLVPGWVIAWELGFGADAPPALVAGGMGLTVIALLMLLKNERTGG